MKITQHSLKDLGRYANFLSGHMMDLDGFKRHSMGGWKKITHKHMLSALPKGAGELTDLEEIEELSQRLEFDLTDALKVYDALVDEMLQLQLTISLWKATDAFIELDDLKLPYDVAIFYAQKLRSQAGSFNDFATCKPEINKKTKATYDIILESSVQPYPYTVETTEKITYDQVFVKSTCKELVQKANQLSSLIDEKASAKTIKFEARFQVEDLLEDIVAVLKNVKE